MRIRYIFLMFLSLNVNAASFDCAKASIRNERLICADKELSDLDSQMATVYYDALKQSANDLKNLKDEQRQWLKDLRINATQESDANRINYLKLSYSSRIATIKKALNHDDSLSEVVNIQFKIENGEKCDDAIVFISNGKLDFGQDVVGAYQSFFDDSIIIKIGYYAEMDKKDGDVLQSLAEKGTPIKINAMLCPKSKDENGMFYLKQGSLLRIF